MEFTDIAKVISGMAGDSLDAQFRWWLAGYAAGWLLCLVNLTIRILRWAAMPHNGGIRTEL